MTITNNMLYVYGKMYVKLKDKKQTKSNKETIINDEIRALFHNRYKKNCVYIFPSKTLLNYYLL